MSHELPRREFLKTVGGACLAAGVRPFTGATLGAKRAASGRLASFDYRGVRLLPGRWQQQSDAARDFYAAIPDDDILHAYRAAAGMSAPGTTLGGWCATDSSLVFGQWLSGMSRLSRPPATRACATRPSAGDRVGQDREAGRELRHAPLPVRQAGVRSRRSAALCRPRRGDSGLLERVTDFASKNLDRSNNLADPEATTGLLRRAAGVVHAVGESLPRLSRHRQSEVQDVRRGVALSRVVEQVRAARLPPPMRTASTPTATSTRSAARRWRTTSSATRRS